MDGTGRESEQQRVMRRLVAAGVALSSTLALDEVLQILVDGARDLVHARYAAIGVINPEGTGLSNFITSGLTPEQRTRLGELPKGHGILGLLIRDARPIRLRDLREHPASFGVPEHHPSMRSFLGVPVLGRGRVFGNLYVTEKIGGDEFDDGDLALLEMLASHAAVAIENARLRQERDRFFAAVSHELGNALASVNLWSRTLLRRPPAEVEQWVEGLEQIARGAADAQRLIEDLLSLSKIQEGRLALHPERVALATIIDDCLSRVRPEAAEAGLTLTFEPPSDRGVIRADPGRVQQIVMNLLGNAVKFTPAGGEIVVGLESGAGHAVVWVRDTGPGIAAADLERIFQPYEQVAREARGRGAGLGLPLSRQLARLMGGELLAESQPGRGSIFRLRLPLAEREAAVV